MSYDHDPTSPLVIFGEELRHARTQAKMTQLGVADELGYGEAQVGHIENGKRRPWRKFAEGCDRLFGTNGYFLRLYEKIERMPTYPAWFGPWAKAERDAQSLYNYEPLIVPGLLQTPDYGRRILRGGRPRDTDEQIDELLAARLDRQQILTTEDPASFWFILDEMALRRPIGGGEVMRAQLDRLREVACWPHVNIQIVPFEAGERPGLSGAFVIASFRDGTDIVYVETAGPAQILTGPRQIAPIRFTYDAIRTHTLSGARSLQLIEEVTAELWT
jgi:transcriptional regulator with XRE-family HTH domain